MEETHRVLFAEPFQVALVYDPMRFEIPVSSPEAMIAGSDQSTAMLEYPGSSRKATGSSSAARDPKGTRPCTDDRSTFSFRTP